MSKLDYLDLDGRGLRLFLTVLDEGSVTRAAERLNVTQSAVSHTLDKLRSILDDALFVRAGRGIVPTQTAKDLADEIRPLLSALERLTKRKQFDPSIFSGEFVVAANDYQRELVIPSLVKTLRDKAPNLMLKIVDSNYADADLLRRDRCDLMITPDPPTGLEFIQRKLFSDQWVCFYDPNTVSAPLTLEDYLSRPHAKVVFTENETSRIDKQLTSKGFTRHIALRVTQFSALPSLMHGTDIIIALPRYIGRTILHNFSHCPLAEKLPDLSFFLVWHIGKNEAPIHRWVRNLLFETVQALHL